jgi:3-dehydroquinate dehydratase-2
MKILVINGPNLNMLGKRNRSIYGGKTLTAINGMLKKEGRSLEVDVLTFQSNSEGDIIDFIQKNFAEADGIIINPGALTHYGLSLRDALSDTGLPIIEVHLSNIYAREDWRAKSVIASISKGQITGLGWRGYVSALRILAGALRGESWE